MADLGRLSEARAICEELIRAQAGFTEAYVLLGVIHQAEGRLLEAQETLRKALYLAPNHVEALTHMVVLCNARGDVPQAAIFQKRLRRLVAEGQA